MFYVVKGRRSLQLLPKIKEPRIVMHVLNFYHTNKKIPEGAVYLGRPMPQYHLCGHKLANPFKLNKDGSNRDEVIKKYRIWLWKQIKEGKITLKDLLDLDGKDLVCFCHPKKCHCDVVISAIEWGKNQ